MDIVFGDVLHGHLIARAAGCDFNPHDGQVISTVRDGRLLGGVIYQDYTGSSFICATASFAPRWMNREFLWAIFDYPFVRCGVRKVLVHIRESNHKSIEFAEHIGFIEEARIDDVFPDGAAVIMSMYRDNCRWLNMKSRLFKSEVSDG